MVPRFITDLEKEYNKKFQDNPATIFYPAEGEEEQAFREMLQKAVETDTPLTEKDLEDFFGKKGYAWLKEWYKEWYGEITWK